MREPLVRRPDTLAAAALGAHMIDARAIGPARLDTRINWCVAQPTDPAVTLCDLVQGTHAAYRDGLRRSATREGRLTLKHSKTLLATPGFSQGLPRQGQTISILAESTLAGTKNQEVRVAEHQRVA